MHRFAGLSLFLSAPQPGNVFFRIHANKSLRCLYAAAFLRYSIQCSILWEPGGLLPAVLHMGSCWGQVFTLIRRFITHELVDCTKEVCKDDRCADCRTRNFHYHVPVDRDREDRSSHRIPHRRSADADSGVRNHDALSLRHSEDTGLRRSGQAWFLDHERHCRRESRRHQLGDDSVYRRNDGYGGGNGQGRILPLAVPDDCEGRSLPAPQDLRHFHVHVGSPCYVH